jgi:hypothetical protein
MFRFILHPSAFILLFALRCAAFDASPLVQFCAAAPSASGNWWDGLNLSSVWPMQEAVGTNILDKAGSVNGVISGATWGAGADGKASLYFNGSGDFVSFGDVYDIGTNSIAFGGWFWRKNTSENVACLIGKARPLTGNPGDYLLYHNAPSINVGLFAMGDAVSRQTSQAVPTNAWTFVAGTVEMASNYFRIVQFYNGTFAAPSAVVAATNLNSTALFIIGKSTDNRHMVGYARDCFVRVGGTTADVARVWSATKATYGY